MNYKKVWRIIDRNPQDLHLAASLHVRRAIGQALVVFFEKLAKLPYPPDPIFVEVARRKQESRNEDERALASGEKSREDLRRENSIFAALGHGIVKLTGLKPLR